MNSVLSLIKGKSKLVPLYDVAEQLKEEIDKEIREYKILKKKSFTEEEKKLARLKLIEIARKDNADDIHFHVIAITAKRDKGWCA